MSGVPESSRAPRQVVKLQLAGRVLDEATLESNYSTEELKNLCKPLMLAPGRYDDTPLADAPTQSFVRELAATCGAWLSSVEDFEVRNHSDPRRPAHTCS